MGSETAYLLLCEETRDRKYLEWVERTANISDGIDEYDRKVKVNGVQHVYTWLARALPSSSTTGKTVKAELK